MKMKNEKGKLALKTSHFFEENVYLLSNHSVALNPMFAEPEAQNFFLIAMRKYLEPVCHIIAHCLNDNEFQLLVKLKCRAAFEEHFKEKNKDALDDEDYIPETTYIFSQSMANLQVSFVKWFNFRYKRSGSLMAGRFIRKLIESEEEMLEWKDRLNEGMKLHNYNAYWRNKTVETQVMVTSKDWYEKYEMTDNQEDTFFLSADSDDLGVDWDKPKKYRLNSTESYYKMRLGRLYHKNGMARF